MGRTQATSDGRGLSRLREQLKQRHRGRNGRAVYKKQERCHLAGGEAANWCRGPHPALRRVLSGPPALACTASLKKAQSIPRARR